MPLRKKFSIRNVCRLAENIVRFFNKTEGMLKKIQFLDFFIEML